MMLQLFVHTMSREDGQSICKWKYEAPFHCYNWPSWELLVQEEREFADDQIRASQYFSIKTNQDELVAYFQLFPLVGTVRLGFFVHPNLLNQGFGKKACLLAIQAAKLRYAQHEIDLEVATWNKRAIHVYEQCGFVINDEYTLYNGVTKKEEVVFNMVYTQVSP